MCAALAAAAAADTERPDEMTLSGAQSHNETRTPTRYVAAAGSGAAAHRSGSTAAYLVARGVVAAEGVDYRSHHSDVSSGAGTAE